MNEKYELALNENIQDRIVLGYGQLLDTLENNSMTIYGNIAYSMEIHHEKINKVAEGIATYFATQKSLQITKEYEETRSFREKWIKGDVIKQKQMEAQREMESNLVSTGIQIVLKGGVYLFAKTLAKADEKKRKQGYWNLCLNFANTITDKNVDSYASVWALMRSIFKKLFNKDCRDFALSTDAELFMPTTTEEAENAAFVLYYIYMAKHSQSFYFRSKKNDFETLMVSWVYLGISGSYADNLLQKFELMEKGNAYEYGRLNHAIQCLHNNLMLTLPNIDNSKVRRVNSELLKYVPNGDKQRACRRAARLASKAAICAAASVAGCTTVNPALLEVAATSALSMYKDLNETEIIGNCLRDAGIDDNSIRKCIEDAKVSQKELPLII